MKIFVAQKVSGEDKAGLTEESREICQILNEQGNEAYCTLLLGDQNDKMTKKELIEHAFEEIDKSEAILVIVRKDIKSEGMLLEIGYSFAKNKKIILLIKKDIANNFVKELANEVIVFEDLEDLKEKLGEIK